MYGLAFPARESRDDAQRRCLRKAVFQRRRFGSEECRQVGDLLFRISKQLGEKEKRNGRRGMAGNMTSQECADGSGNVHGGIVEVKCACRQRWGRLKPALKEGKFTAEG